MLYVLTKPKKQNEKLRNYTIDVLNNYCSHADRERFMKMLFKDYDKLKFETINFYEQQITDRLLDDMSGLRKFLESFNILHDKYGR